MTFFDEKEPRRVPLRPADSVWDPVLGEWVAAPLSGPWQAVSDEAADDWDARCWRPVGGEDQ